MNGNTCIDLTEIGALKKRKVCTIQTEYPLLKNNHEVIIADNLSNPKIIVLDKLIKITGIKPTCHVKAIENMNSGVNIYNLGTGRGTSVLELVNAFMNVNKVDVHYEIIGRRPSGIATCFADPSKAEKELGWKAKLSIDEMVRMYGDMN